VSGHAAPSPTPVHWHVLKLAGGASIVGILAASEGAIVGAVIAGVFTLVNTGLTVWLTGRDGEQRRRTRRRHDDDE
jgi:hypothetical protein